MKIAVMRTGQTRRAIATIHKIRLDWALANSLRKNGTSVLGSPSPLGSLGGGIKGVGRRNDPCERTARCNVQGDEAHGIHREVCPGRGFERLATRLNNRNRGARP